jgi:hypothetical protein
MCESDVSSSSSKKKGVFVYSDAQEKHCRTVCLSKQVIRWMVKRDPTTWNYPRRSRNGGTPVVRENVEKGAKTRASRNCWILTTLQSNVFGNQNWTTFQSIHNPFYSCPPKPQEIVPVLDHLPSPIPLGARCHRSGHCRPPGQDKGPTPLPLLAPKCPRRHFSRLFRGSNPTLPIFPKLHGLNPQVVFCQRYYRQHPPPSGVSQRRSLPFSTTTTVSAMLSTSRLNACRQKTSCLC